MRLGIDACNIRTGGGLVHLIELLSAAEPEKFGIKSVVVWGSKSTLHLLPQRSWLQLEHEALLDGRLPARLWWQRFRLPRLAKASCDLLFVPGGLHLADSVPFVTLLQNYLPFDPVEIRRYGFGAMALRLHLLRRGQSNTLRRAAGVVFLARFAQQQIGAKLGYQGRSIVVQHGIGEGFRCPPREQRPLKSYSAQRPFRFLYVSTIEPYKQHSNLVRAVAGLRKRGMPIALDIVGPAEAEILAKLNSVIAESDPKGEFVNYVGSVPYDSVRKMYFQADAFVFPSTCEMCGIPLLEAIAASLPVACSDRSVMPEILGDAGVYFDPENLGSMMTVLQELAQNSTLRSSLSAAAFVRSQQFSWRHSADNTFGFFADVARGCGIQALPEPAAKRRSTTVASSIADGD